MREPCILRWPRVIPEGHPCRELCTAMDILPTLARLPGTEASKDRIIDGKDIFPLMADPKAKTPHDALFHYTEKPRFQPGDRSAGLHPILTHASALGRSARRAAAERKAIFYCVKEKPATLATFPVEADADISARPIFDHPRAGTLVSAGILTQGSPAAIDDSNTCVVALKDDAGNTIVTKTYNTGTQPPSSDYEDLGALDGTHKALTAAEHVTLDVTQGANADMPAFTQRHGGIYNDCRFYQSGGRLQLSTGMYFTVRPT